MPPPSPTHVKPTLANLVTIQDVLDTSSPNVNPLTIEDLKKIIHQTSIEAQLCNNEILVSVEELQKVVAEITKEKVNPQEPPSHTTIDTSGKLQEQVAQDTSTRFDSIVVETSTTEQQGKDQIG